jgi:hypothetical protein
VTADQEYIEWDDCITKRRKWWVIKFEGGGYYGDRPHGDGFDLALYETKSAAEEEFERISEDEEWPPHEIVEICWADVR